MPIAKMSAKLESNQSMVNMNTHTNATVAPMSPSNGDVVVKF